MADNSTLPATGDVIGTDDVGGVKYQQVKLVTSELNASEGIGDTDLGTYRALWTDQRSVLIDQQLTSAGLTTASTAYSANDVMGTIMELTSAARASGGSGMITGLSILDEADILGAVDLVISKASISQTDNAAFAPSDSDARSILHKIRFPPLEDLGGCRFISLDGLQIEYYSAATSLWFTLISVVGQTFFAAATDIKLNVFGYKF